MPQCCPPPVSVSSPPCPSATHRQCLLRFLRAPMLPTVSVRSVFSCPSAVHRQCLLRFSVPQCCPPSVPVPFPPCPSATHRQCPLRFLVPQCCPPSVSVPFLRAPVLSTVSARSVSQCTETMSVGSAVSLMLERTCFSFQSNEEKWLEWGTPCEIEPLVVAVA